ncbi:MAG: hypothetical protein ACREAO_10795, partial [Nitrososphaera sp.]
MLANPDYEQACGAIASRLEQDAELSAADVRRLFRETAARYRLATVPANEDIISRLAKGSR